MSRTGKYGRYHLRPTSMRPLTDVEAAWVAAWLEAEGSFSMRARRDGQIRSPFITCANSDLTVLERLQSLTGIGRLYHEIHSSPLSKKPIHRWIIGSVPDAMALMDRIIPYLMGKQEDWTSKLEELRHP